MDMLKGVMGGAKSGGSKPDKQKQDAVTESVFKQFDKDNSGELDKAELKAALTLAMSKLGMEEPSDKMLGMVVKFGDKDKDGAIDKKEFASLVEKLTALAKPKEGGAAH